MVATKSIMLTGARTKAHLLGLTTNLTFKQRDEFAIRKSKKYGEKVEVKQK